MFAPRDKHYLLIQFKLAIYSKKGNEFQTFFENIMEKAYDDFQRIRPYGNEGDRGNDGYRKESGIYYQVYAPQTPQTNYTKAVKKLKEDFYKLKNNWDDISKIKEYYFVFNDKYNGSTQKLEEAITELEKENVGIKFNIFIAKNLEKIFFTLDDTNILDLGFDIDSTKAVSIAFKVLENIKIEIDKEYSKSALNMLENTEEIVFSFDDDSLKLEYELIETKCFQKLEKIDIAKEKYKNITKNFPNDSQAFLYLAEIYLQEDNQKKCNKLIKIAERTEPDHWLLNIVKLIKKINLMEKINLQEINEEEFPSDKRIKSNFYRLYGILLEISKDSKSSDNFIEKAISLNPDDYSNHVAKLSICENRMNLKKHETTITQDSIKLLDQIKNIEKRFHESGDVGPRNKSIINMIKFELLLKLEDYSNLDNVVEETLEYCLNCYFNRHIDQILTRLLNYLQPYEKIFDNLMLYLEIAKKEISDELAKVMIFQFNIRGILFEQGKGFFKRINKTKYYNFINDIENKNDEKVTAFLKNDIQFELRIAATLKNNPDLRKKLIQDLPNDKNIQKDKLLLILNYDEKNYDEAFSILKNIDLSKITYHECIPALKIAQEKKAWEFEVIILEKLLEKENYEKSIFSLKSELFHAKYNLGYFSDMIKIGEELLEKDQTCNFLNRKNKEILLAQTISACFERGKVDESNYKKAKELIVKYSLPQSSFEFKISIESQVYFKNNEPRKALETIFEGIKIKKFLSSEEYAKLYFLIFIQIGKIINLKINNLEEVKNNTFVKLKDNNEWYFIGNGNELNATKITEENISYYNFINKNISDEVIFQGKYSSDSTKAVIEYIFSIDRYILWQIDNSFKRLSKRNLLDGVQLIDTPKKEDSIDTSYLIRFLEDLDSRSSKFFELYCKERLPFAMLAVIEGGVASALGKITREDKGFIHFSSGSIEELEMQKNIARKVIDECLPFYLDSTSALFLSEVGYLGKVIAYLPNLKVPQSVINLLIKISERFHLSNDQFGQLIYSKGNIIFSSVEKEKSKKIRSNFIESIKLLESNSERIVAISQANKIDCFSEQKIPGELNDACILAQKENISILTDDYLYLKMNEVETGKKAPEYFSSLVLLKILNEKDKISFDDYLNYFGYLSSYRLRFLSFNRDDLEKAVLGDKQIINLNTQNIKNFNFSITLSEEYGFSLQSAFSVLGGFFLKILTDDTIIPEVVENIFIEIIDNLPTEYKKFIGYLLINCCDKEIKKCKSSVILTRPSKVAKEKIERLNKAIEIFGSRFY
jgi:hypothetical protein